MQSEGFILQEFAETAMNELLDLYGYGVTKKENTSICNNSYSSSSESDSSKYSGNY